MEQHDIDKKLEQLKKSNRNSGMLYTLIPLTILCTVLILFWSDLEKRDQLLDEKDKELKEKEKMLTEKEERINALDSTLGGKDAEILQYYDQIEDLEVDKTDSTSIVLQRIEQKINADTTIARLQETKAFNKKNKIEYYKQASDGDKVINALAKFGLVLKKDYDTLSSKIKYNIGPINSIKYGSNVDEHSRQMLLLQLIKEGFEIRAVEPMKENKGSENKIVIYRNSHVLDNQVISVDMVKGKKMSY